MEQKRATMTQWGKGQWRVNSWDADRKAWWETGSMTYWAARALVGQINCRNPQTCDTRSHDHHKDITPTEGASV